MGMSVVLGSWEDCCPKCGSDQTGVKKVTHNGKEYLRYDCICGNVEEFEVYR